MRHQLLFSLCLREDARGITFYQFIVALRIVCETEGGMVVFESRKYSNAFCNKGIILRSKCFRVMRFLRNNRIIGDIIAEVNSPSQFAENVTFGDNISATCETAFKLLLLNRSKS